MAKHTKYLYLLIGVRGNWVRDTWLIKSNKKNLSILEALKATGNPPVPLRELTKDALNFDLVSIEPGLAMEIEDKPKG